VLYQKLFLNIFATIIMKTVEDGKELDFILDVLTAGQKNQIGHARNV